ncbi:MAG: acylphosphatase [Erysipelotrichaceae bacterium]|nr:acylphosphatase [Erysipelotrichaceae bacterium]
MERYLVVFVGRVQGVGFRYTVYHTARCYGLTGYVKNRGNGDVEAQIQGESENIAGFLSDMLSDSLREQSFIRIIDYSLRKIDLVEGEKDFRVTY